MSKSVTYVARPATLPLTLKAINADGGSRAWGDKVVQTIASYKGDDSGSTNSARSAFNARNTSMCTPQVTIEVAQLGDHALPLLQAILGAEVHVEPKGVTSTEYARGLLKRTAEMR